MLNCNSGNVTNCPLTCRENWTPNCGTDAAPFPHCVVLIINAKYVWSIGLYEGKTYTLVAGENSFLTLEIVV